MKQQKSKTSISDDILTGNLWRVMAKLSVPGVLGMLVISLNNFTDALFVGQLIGTNGLAAISLVFPLTLINGGLSSMLGVGAASLLSRKIGSKNDEEQGKIFGNVLGISVIIALLVSILGFTFAEDLVFMMGGRGEVLELGTAYYRIIILGAIHNMFGLPMNMLIRAEGKLKEAMIFVAVSMCLNIILNPIFIKVFGWGIQGAALATLFSMTIYTLLNLQYFLRRKTSYFIESFRPVFNGAILKDIFSVGISASLMPWMYFLQQAVIFKSIAFYGTDNDIAFMGASYRILMLIVVPIFGFVQSFQPVVGINYGAGNYDRVIKAFNVFTLTGTLVLFLLWIPMEIFPRTVLSWILPDFDFNDQYIQYFRVFALLLPTLTVMFMGVSFFQSMGKGFMAGILVAGRQLFFFIPVVLIMGYFFQVDGVFYSPPLVDAVVLFATLAVIMYEIRKLGNKQVLKEEKELKEKKLVQETAKV